MSYTRYDVYNPFAPRPLPPPSKGIEVMKPPSPTSPPPPSYTKYINTVFTPALPSPTLTLTKPSPTLTLTTPGGSRHRRTHRKGGKSHRKGGKSHRRGRKTRRH